MALVICPNCGASISDKAISCPKCKASSKVLKINLLSAYVKIWSRAFNFEGTSNRREFWLGFFSLLLMNIFVFLVIELLNQTNNNPFSYNYSGFGGAIIWLICVMHFFGSFLAIFSGTIRRIRDVGKSPYFILWNLIPFVGIPMTLFVCFQQNNNKRFDS